jgi:trans-2,3-dihydro-3-hydroxyanthranilate isomerase
MGPYTGNQFAVIRDAAAYSAGELRQIAREMNYPETSFLVGSEPRGDGVSVRIFTPTMELPFAGPSTLGTAHVVRTRLLEGRPDNVTLSLANGPITVTVEPTNEGEVYWMDQCAAEFATEVDHETVAAVSGLEVDDLDTRYPVREVSTGLPALVAPSTASTRFDERPQTGAPTSAAWGTSNRNRSCCSGRKPTSRRTT